MNEVLLDSLNSFPIAWTLAMPWEFLLCWRLLGLFCSHSMAESFEWSYSHEKVACRSKAVWNSRGNKKRVSWTADHKPQSWYADSPAALPGEALCSYAFERLGFQMRCSHNLPSSKRSVNPPNPRFLRLSSAFRLPLSWPLLWKSRGRRELTVSRPIWL